MNKLLWELFCKLIELSSQISANGVTLAIHLLTIHSQREKEPADYRTPFVIPFMPLSRASHLINSCNHCFVSILQIKKGTFPLYLPEGLSVYHASILAGFSDHVVSLFSPLQNCMGVTSAWSQEAEELMVYFTEDLLQISILRILIVDVDFT